MTAAQVPGFQPQPADPIAFAQRMDAAFATDDAAAVRAIGAELEANPELAGAKHPNLDMTLGEFLKVATEPARTPADRKMDQMRVPGKAAGVNQFQPGYDYGGRPVESLADAGTADNLSDYSTLEHSNEDIARTTTPGPSEGGPPTQQATPAPPREGPPAPAPPGWTGAPVGGVMPPEFNPRQLFDLVNKTYSDRFDAAFEAGAGGIRDEDRKTREMAARFASALGLPPEQAAAVYSKVVEPQLQRETSERNAQMVAQQRSSRAGFGQGLSDERFALADWKDYASRAQLEEKAASLANIAAAHRYLAASEESGGLASLDATTIKTLITALEERVSDKDVEFQFGQHGLSSVWGQMRDFFQRQVGQPLGDKVAGMRSILKGMPPAQRLDFRKSIEAILAVKLRGMENDYAIARRKAEMAPTPNRREFFKQKIREYFPRSIWEDDDFINSSDGYSPQSGGGSGSSESDVTNRVERLKKKGGY